MKRYNKIFAILILVFIIATVFVACKDSELVLSAPTGLNMNGNTFSWSEVVNAQGYEVILGDDAPIIVEGKTFTELTITDRGTYYIKIRAFAKNENEQIIYSSYKELKHVVTDKLPTPVLVVDGDDFSWAAINNADTYEIKVLDATNKEQYTATQNTTSFKFSDTKITTVGRYTVQVVAIPQEGSSFIKSSAGSRIYCIQKTLDAPVITGITTSNIRWGEVSSQKGYIVDLYYETDGEDILVKSYDSAANSFSLSALDFETNGPGTYYCLLTTKGDTGANRVYLNSNKSVRDTQFDLVVLPKVDKSAFNLTNTADGKTMLNITLNSAYELKNISIDLQTTTPEGNNSLSIPSHKIPIQDAKLSYEVASPSEFNPDETYYVYREEYTKVNTGVSVDLNETYYIKPAAEYELVNGDGKLTDFEDNVEYFTKKEIYEVAYGEPVYELVNKVHPITSGTRYFIKNASDVYEEVFNLTKYEDGVDYYRLKTTKIEAFANGVVYHKLKSAEFELCLDDLFYKELEDGKINYLVEDNAKYGKLYNISISLVANQNRFIISKDIKMDEQFLSIRKPQKIDKGVLYNESPIRSYFDDNDAYLEFATKHHGYYAVTVLGELQYINKEPDANYVIMEDLNCNSYTWKPISEFNGKLDGNYKRIKNIVFSTIKDVDEYALFNTIGSTAEVKDLFIENIGVNFAKKLERKIAGIAVNLFGTISGCYVSGKLSNATEVAGIAINVNESASIINSQNYASISAISKAAGIAISNTGKIKGTYNVSSIEAIKGYLFACDKDTLDSMDDATELFVLKSGSYVSVGTKTSTDIKDENGDYYSEYYIPSNPAAYAGGLVVSNLGLGQIESSYSLENVSADAKEKAVAGGLVAENFGLIKTSYAGNKYSSNIPERKLVKAEANNETYAGGFVAYNAGEIENCYSTIRALAQKNFGGFVGNNNGTIKNSYATGGVAAQGGANVNKGAFVGLNSDTAILENVYYYKALSSESYEDAAAQKLATLEELKNKMVEVSPNAFAINPSYNEPILLNLAYASSLKAEIKSAALISNVVEVAKKDGENVVINKLVKEDYKVIGTTRVKGNALVIIEDEFTRTIIEVKITN